MLKHVKRRTRMTTVPKPPAAKTVTAFEYLEAEHAQGVARYRQMLIAALRASDQPREIIAAHVAEVEAMTDAEIDAGFADALATLPADELAERDRAVARSLEIAIYKGDVSTAVWFLRHFELGGEADVRQMLPDVDVSALLTQAREVAAGRSN
jgi:hypothetical protein